MATDTLTVKFRLQADFQTIQALRLALGVSEQEQALARRLAEVVEKALTAYDVGSFKLVPTLKVSRCSEIKKGSRLPPPLVKDNLLILWDYDLDRQIGTIPVDGRDWLTWLEAPTTQSFRYEAEIGTFTAIREKRQDRQIWYAHRRVEGALKRAYLGKSTKVTASKLAEIARRLNQAGVTWSH